MHRINAGRRKKIISASIAGVLTVAVVSTALYKDSSVALARPSLPGIEDIVNGNSSSQPFKILEIVDQYENARIGFTIAGEEPSNKNAQAISDMASYGERSDYFMPDYDSTDPIDNSGWNTAFDELNTHAFAYEDYDKGSAPGTAGAYDADTDGIKVGKSYGTFETNSDTKGRYDDADTSGDYVQVNDGTPTTNPATNPNKTIDEVYQKLPGTDQTGYFYMNYAGFLYNGDVTDADNYTILQYDKITSDNSWMFPYKIYEEDVNTDINGNPLLDSDGNPYSVHYQYYDDDRYIKNEPYDPITDENDADDDNDDVYKFSTNPTDGSVIYTDEDDGKLRYFGYIKTIGGVLSLCYDADGDGTIDESTETVPVSARIYEFDPDTNGDPQKDTDGNTILKLDGSGNPIPIESFAKIALDDPSIKYTTLRKATNEDGSGITKYYISSSAKGVGGLYSIATLRFQAVNDPAVLPEEFGITDESEKGLFPAGPSGANTWYHVWYYKAQSNSPYVYNATSTGKYDFKHDYTAPEVDTYYYKGGYTNYEWFKKEVLDVDDADCGKICIDVITKKVNEVTADDINDADLIYFTGGNYADGTDIDQSAATAILTAIDNPDVRKPVIINLTCYTDKVHAAYEADATGNTFKNLRNMFVLLLMESIDGVSTNFIEDGKWKNIQPATQAILSSRGGAYVTATNDCSHVIQSVFINDDRKVNDAIYTDFVAAYSADKIRGFEMESINYPGFQAVQEDIDEELFYLKVAGKDESKFNSTISKATSIRYILNYGGRRTVAKNSIRVLDIEPFYARDVEGDAEEYTNIAALSKIYYNKNNDYTVDNISQIRDIFTKKWFKENVVPGETAKDVDITGMGTREFIGKIEDINESYDLIYIGMDTAYLNTDVTVKSNKHVDKTKNVVGNQSNFHYVYSHTGDTVSPTKVSNYDSGRNGIGGPGTWNMSGNDITPSKLNELKNYVKSGYAVILSDEFFKVGNDGKILKDSSGNLVIDTDRIEGGDGENNTGSYIYDFVYWCTTQKDGNDYKYLYKNVEISRNFESTSLSTDGNNAQAHRDTFVKYMNISKLELEVLEQPLLYNPYDTNSNDVHHYLAMNNQGKYTLDYKIKLTNDAAVDTTKTNYDCKLYIDHDADGRYENVEALDSLDITNNDNGDYIYPGDDGKYHLTTGTTYSISREVPEGYVGLISWKLVFIENRSGNDDAQIKTAIQDYSAISDLANKPTIHVLQLTQDQNNGNDEPTPHNPPGNSNSYNHLNLKDDPRLKELYGYVTEFNIDVDLVWVRDYVKMQGTIFGNGKTRLQNLDYYDIVVMGFSDSYRITPDNATDGVTLQNAKDAILALREYALSGKSILFTHDLTSPTHATTDILGYNTLSNRYLRDIQGMDRYGYIASNVEDLTLDGVPLTKYKSEYDRRFRTDNGVSSGTEKIGFTNQAIIRWNGSNYGDIAAEFTRSTDGSNRYTTKPVTDERQFYSVKRLNRGQVTEYPFRIGSMTQNGWDKDGNPLYYANEYITTAQTHTQWYQLNLETDYNDENYDDDVVVWYTLTEPGTSKLNYHKLDSDDARNNYYIFNKGNITYTGAGHYWIDGDEEKKLFVNTLVASYNAGKHAPYAAYKNNDTRLATDITSTYIPYDVTFSQTTAEDGGDENGWIQDTVTVYFKTVNNNLQDNLRPLIAKYYVEVPTGGDIVIGTTHYKVITPVANSVKMCTATSSGIVYTDVADAQVLENGRVYKMDFRVSDLMNGDLQGVNTRYHAKIYTRMRSQSANKTLEQELAEINATDTTITLPANDSLKPLNVNFTQLYDLK